MKPQDLYHHLVRIGYTDFLTRHGSVLTESSARYITQQALLLVETAQAAWEAHEQQSLEEIDEPEETQPSLDRFGPRGITVSLCERTCAMKVAFPAIYCLIYPLKGKLYLWTLNCGFYPKGFDEEVVSYWRTTVGDKDIPLVRWSSSEIYGQGPIDLFNPESTQGAIEQYLSQRKT